MCFSPKMKAPKVDTTVVPEPAPLTEEPKGIQFGGDSDSNSSTSSEVSGRKSLKVEKTTAAPTSKIRKSALGG